MRSVRWATMIPLMGIAAACGPEQGVNPPPGRPTVVGPHATVFPAAAYKPTVLLLEGWFEDVNDANLIVGMANGNAVAMQLGGTVTPLSSCYPQLVTPPTSTIVVASSAPSCAML